MLIILLLIIWRMYNRLVFFVFQIFLNSSSEIWISSRYFCLIFKRMTPFFSLVQSTILKVSMVGRILITRWFHFKLKKIIIQSFLLSLTSLCNFNVLNKMSLILLLFNVSRLVHWSTLLCAWSLGYFDY